MSGSAPAGAPSVDSRRGSVATFSTWLKSLKIRVSGSWAARSRAVALSASRAGDHRVGDGDLDRRLVHVEDVTTDPVWLECPLGHATTEALSCLEGTRSAARHERDGATQLPYDAVLLAKWLAALRIAGHNSPRPEPPNPARTLATADANGAEQRRRRTVRR